MPTLRELIARAVAAAVDGALGELARQCGREGFLMEEFRSAGIIASSVFVNLATQQGDAIDWCRARNALVRFESDGSVSVKANGTKRRRRTLTEAVLALRYVMEPVS